MLVGPLVVAGVLSTAVMVAGYDDRPMNEDEYFGARMHEHHQGQGLYQEPQGRGRYGLMLGALAGVGIEWFWTGRSIKKGKKDHNDASTEFVAKWNKDRDALIARRTYPIKLMAHEVEEANLQLLQLEAAAADAGIDVSQLGIGGYGSGGGAGRGSRSAYQDSIEYEEFKQPDANGDNVITKQEFNQYIRSYLMMYPDTIDGDIPRFEDFDLNRDGVVTFDEWQMYLDHHRQTDPYDSELMQGMYDTSTQAQGFNTLSQNLQRAQNRGRY